MAETALERVLHYKCPEWSDSIESARSEVGFFFKLQHHELWKWLVSGGHKKAKEFADRETKKLGVEEFYEYYLCCFYSDHKRPGGTIDFEAIKGPPWVKLECPAMLFGEDWQRSIQSAREDIDHKLGDKNGLAKGKTSKKFLSWYFDDGGADEVTKLSLNEVQRLGMEDINSLLWICCLSPQKVYRLVDRSGLFYSRFPQLLDWDNIALICPHRTARHKVRAYPSGIDWSQGAKPPDDFPMLPTRPGIHYQIVSDADSRPMLNVSWDPLIVTSEKDLAAATKDLQRYYKAVHQPHLVGKTPGILEKLTQQKRKGGRPQWGIVEDAIALECARLMDEEGLTKAKIADRFDFGKQSDDYGNLSRSSTVRYYVRRGRQLHMEQKKYQQ